MKGPGVKKGRSREGPITAQLRQLSAAYGTWTRRENDTTQPPSSERSIVLAGFLLFSASPPSDWTALTEGNHIRLMTGDKFERSSGVESVKNFTFFYTFSLIYFFPFSLIYIYIYENKI